jgi:hypothetical protein
VLNVSNLDAMLRHCISPLQHDWHLHLANVQFVIKNSFTVLTAFLLKEHFVDGSRPQKERISELAVLVTVTVGQVALIIRMLKHGAQLPFRV